MYCQVNLNAAFWRLLLKVGDELNCVSYVKKGESASKYRKSYNENKKMRTKLKRKENHEMIRLVNIFFEILSINIA